MQQDGPAPDEHRVAARLVALAALAFLLFAPPLLGIFDRPIFVLGVPLLAVYLFTAWAAVIVFVALAVRSAGSGDE